MSIESLRSHPAPSSPTIPSTETSGPNSQKIDPSKGDHREASAQMLTIRSTRETPPVGQACLKSLPTTCRHFRYRVPREDADELRDADPEPCPVCDVLPHRRARLGQGHK